MTSFFQVLNHSFKMALKEDPYLLWECKYKKINEVESLLDSTKSIADKLADIEDYLANSIFSNENPILDSDSKQMLSATGKLFPFVNEHIGILANPSLVQKLKIQFANLPSPSDRSCFPNLLLSSREKLEILISKLQEKEAQTFAELISFIKDKTPDIKETRILAKLLSPKSPISKEIQRILQAALGDRLGNSDGPCGKYPSEPLLQLDPKSLPSIEAAYRLSKTCRYFESQCTFSEERIFIPHWYHSTDWENVDKIVKSGFLKVGHRKYVGAWVSSRREEDYGDFTFCFNGTISRLDTMPSFSNKNSERWIGLQKNIPLQNTFYLGIIARPCRQKHRKVEILASLKSSEYRNIRVFSDAQVDSIKDHVTSILGHPNLPELWWSETTILPIYQQHLQEIAKQIGSDATLKELLKKEDPSLIPQLVQRIVPPFYKILMPQYPTYQLEEGLERASLDSEDSESDAVYVQRQKEVVEKQIPAREIHGTMHSARTTLWGQVLRLACLRYEVNEPVNPILLALACALHDAARENEEKDFWDRESAKLLEIILKGIGVSEDQIKIYVQAIAEKDPKDNIFTTLAQLIMQGADCIEIMRLIDLIEFDVSKFQLYQYYPAMRPYLARIYREAVVFIKLTEEKEFKRRLEHESKDMYGDLVRLLFKIQAEDPTKFSTLTEILSSNKMKETSL